MSELNNLVKQVSDQVPKAGIWLTLTNIRLALEIFFETIYKLLHLGFICVVCYVAYTQIPWANLINQLSK
jgi:hypothetical protein